MREGVSAQRFDDLELICRNEVNVAKFRKLVGQKHGDGKAAVERPDPADQCWSSVGSVSMARSPVR